MTQQELQAAFAKALQETGVVSWEKRDYSFNFDTGVFKWRYKVLCPTWRERLYLYRRLVQGFPDKTTGVEMALYTMRRKFGAAFLEDIKPWVRAPKSKGGILRWEDESWIVTEMRRRFEVARQKKLPKEKLENGESLEECSKHE